MTLVVPDGMEVIRSAIDPEVALSFQNEMFGYLSQLRRDALFGRFDEEHLRPKFITMELGEDWETYEFSAAKAIAQTLDLEVNTENGYSFTANFQPGGTAQDFHADNPLEEDRVYIVHGGNEGAFDFAIEAQTTEEALSTYSSIEFNAGDLLIQSMPYILHRGRNTGTQPRVTGVFSKIKDKYGYI